MDEVWKQIKDCENYLISSYGKVKSLKNNIILKQQIKKNYCLVYLYNKNGKKAKLVHRLVANAFIPNVNNFSQINHKDENPLNNKVDNLEWCTPKYNSNYGHHNEKLKKNKTFLGKHHTLESKEKMRLAKINKPSLRKRKISINGIEYESITEAMKKLKYSTRKIYKLVGGINNV